MEACCPRCEAPGQFDEDPELYLAVEPHLVRRVDPAMARALGALGELRAAPIRKSVVGIETWITLATRLDGDLRLQRALDGLEGHVVFDLSAVSHTTVAGVDRFLQRLRALGPEVSELQLVGCPQEFLVQLLHDPTGQAPDPRLALASVRVAATCPDPPTRRQVLVDLRMPSHVDALRRGHAPLSHDGHFAAVDLEEALPLLIRALRLAPSSVVPSPPVAWSSEGRPPRRRGTGRLVPGSVPVEAFDRSFSSLGSAPRLAGRLPPVPTSRSVRSPVVPPVWSAWSPPARPPRFVALIVGMAALVAGGLVGATGLLGGALLVMLDSGSLDASTLAAWVGSPTRAEQPFTYTGTGIDLVATVGAASADASRREVYQEVMRTYLDHLARGVRRSGAYALALPSTHALSEGTLDQAIDAYQAGAGGFAQPTWVDGTMRRLPWGVTASARYSLADDAWRAAVAYYADTVEFRGLTVARRFPTLATGPTADAGVVIVATRPWMRAAEPGDAVLKVAGAPVPDLDTFRSEVSRAWSEIGPGSGLQILVRRDDQVRPIEFRKPAR